MTKPFFSLKFQIVTPTKKLKYEPPHIITLPTKFFDNFFNKNTFCKTFSNYEEQREDNGEVIILLSQSNININ